MPFCLWRNVVSLFFFKLESIKVVFPARDLQGELFCLYLTSRGLCRGCMYAKKIPKKRFCKKYSSSSWSWGVLWDWESIFLRVCVPWPKLKVSVTKFQSCQWISSPTIWSFNCWCGQVHYTLTVTMCALGRQAEDDREQQAARSCWPSSWMPVPHGDFHTLIPSLCCSSRCSTYD